MSATIARVEIRDPEVRELQRMVREHIIRYMKERYGGIRDNIVIVTTTPGLKRGLKKP